MDEVVGMIVVMKGKCVRLRRAQSAWKLPQIPYTDKVFGVPMAMQHQVPTVPVR